MEPHWRRPGQNTSFPPSEGNASSRKNTATATLTNSATEEHPKKVLSESGRMKQSTHAIDTCGISCACG